MTNENNPGSFGSSRGLSQKLKKDKNRKSSSTRWIGRQLNDPYVLETQKRGYKSRAAFKPVSYTHLTLPTIYSV